MRSWPTRLLGAHSCTSSQTCDSPREQAAYIIRPVGSKTSLVPSGRCFQRGFRVLLDRLSLLSCRRLGLPDFFGYMKRERETRTAMEDVDSAMEFPFSIFVYQAPLRSGDKAYWIEALRVNTQEWAIYAAGLLHNAGAPPKPETKPVVKAVRSGLTFLALPDEHAVELCERMVARQPPEPPLPFWAKRGDRE